MLMTMQITSQRARQAANDRRLTTFETISAPSLAPVKKKYF
jgi:hypothetical protein